MTTFSPPSFIPTTWTAETREPASFVPLRECTGRQLAVAMIHAGSDEYPDLKSLMVLFRRANGASGDTIGNVLRLAPLRRERGNLVNATIPSRDGEKIGTSNFEFQRKFNARRLAR